MKIESGEVGGHKKIKPNNTHIPYYNGNLQVYIMEERVDYKAKELT